MAVTEYVIPLGDNVRKRHYHETKKGKIIRFAVQLEIFHTEKWLPVIRDDAAHGFSHMDRYRKDGTKTKNKLDLTRNDVLTLADEDIKENWKGYARMFMEGK
jgi:hypothetical protein